MFDFSAVFSRFIPSALMLAGAAFAAEPVVVDGLGVQVSTIDVMADALRIPPEQRKEALAKPENIEQIAANLFVRRALAEQAEREGLQSDPVVIAALKIARDRVLSDAQLVKINEANKPTEAALDAYAASVYKADTDRFKLPEQLRARHILLPRQEGAREKAQKLLEELKAGADFEALARQHSADKGSAEKGGDLGRFGRGRMVPPFENAVFALTKPGDLTDVVETQFGFHIIRLDARETNAIRPFEEVREALREEARSKVLQDARGAESQRLLGSARFDKAAIEALAASQR